jgi:hypothetical protein
MKRAIDTLNTKSSFQNLQEFIDTRQTNCLNEKKGATVKELLKEDDFQTYLESDADEQLLLNVVFMGDVKISSLLLIAPLDGNIYSSFSANIYIW